MTSVPAGVRRTRAPSQTSGALDRRDTEREPGSLFDRTGHQIPTSGPKTNRLCVDSVLHFCRTGVVLEVPSRKVSEFYHQDSRGQSLRATGDATGRWGWEWRPPEWPPDKWSVIQTRTVRYWSDRGNDATNRRDPPPPAQLPCGTCVVGEAGVGVRTWTRPSVWVPTGGARVPVASDRTRPEGPIGPNPRTSAPPRPAPEWSRRGSGRSRGPGYAPTRRTHRPVSSGPPSLQRSPSGAGDGGHSDTPVNPPTPDRTQNPGPDIQDPIWHFGAPRHSLRTQGGRHGSAPPFPPPRVEEY